MCTRYPQSFRKLNVDFWLNFLSSLSRVFTDYNKKKTGRLYYNKGPAENTFPEF